jgi:hypothetical protein
MSSEFHWGYVAASFAFVLSTLQAAPAVALASRLANGDWGIPARRLCDVLGLAALVTAPVGIVLLLQLPDWHGRPSVWFDWPGAPQIWHSLAYLILTLVAVALARVAAAPGGQGWYGAERQWRVIGWASVTLGALYLMTFVLVQTLVSSDFALSLVTGWSSGSFPPYLVVSAFEGGVATTVLALALLHHAGHAVPRETFNACARLLLALALLWFYFIWSEFLTYWYGRLPEELELLTLLMLGPSSLLAFVAAALLCCLLPVALLIWNPIRGSVMGTTLVAALVVLGLLIDRVRVFSVAWSVVTPPSLAELLAMVAVPAAAVLVVLLGVRRTRATRASAI